MPIPNINYNLRLGKRVRKKDLLKREAIRLNPLSSTIINAYFYKNSPATAGTASVYCNSKTLDFDKLLNDLYEFVLGHDYDFKIRFLFGIYDSNRDNRVDRNEMYALLCIICDQNLERHKIMDVVDDFYREKEYIGFEEFKDIIEKHNSNLKRSMRC